MEAAIVSHILKNISAFEEDGIRAEGAELQCKTRDFQNSQLWGQFSPGSEGCIWNPVDHVVYPPSSTPGNWNFWATSSEKKVSPVGGSKLANFITRPSLQIAPKFERLDILGLKTYQKPIATTSVRFEMKTIWPKNGFFEIPKMAVLAAPGPAVRAGWAKRGSPAFVLGPSASLVRVSSKSDSGRRQCSVLLTCNHS